MSTNSNIDDIDLAITTRIYVDPPGVAGTEIYMRARLTEEAKARVQQELLKARIEEIRHLYDFYEKNPDYSSNYITERIADLQAKLKENSDG